jgi:hypothetical protein
MFNIALSYRSLRNDNFSRQSWRKWKAGLFSLGTGLATSRAAEYFMVFQRVEIVGGVNGVLGSSASTY